MTAPIPLLVTVSIVSLLGLIVALLALASVWRRRLRDDQTEIARHLNALGERLSALEAARVDEKGPRSASPIVHRVDRSELSTAATPTLIAVPNLAVEQGGEPSSAAEMGRRFATVWERGEAGESAESIARDLGQPVGQVELILGLKRQLSAASPSSATSGSRLP